MEKNLQTVEDVIRHWVLEEEKRQREPVSDRRRIMMPQPKEVQDKK